MRLSFLFLLFCAVALGPLFGTPVRAQLIAGRKLASVGPGPWDLFPSSDEAVGQCLAALMHCRDRDHSRVRVVTEVWCQDLGHERVSVIGIGEVFFAAIAQPLAITAYYSGPGWASDDNTSCSYIEGPPAIGLKPKSFPHLQFSVSGYPQPKACGGCTERPVELPTGEVVSVIRTPPLLEQLVVQIGESLGLSLDQSRSFLSGDALNEVAEAWRRNDMATVLLLLELIAVFFLGSALLFA